MRLPVRVRRGGGRDRFGDPLPTSQHVIGDCVLWPQTSTEAAGDYSQTVAVGYMLSLPPGADLRPSDEVLLPGEPEQGPWWSVQGEPLAWGPNPFTGRVAGLVVALSRSTG